MTRRLAIVGPGKIARDQHIPSIAGNPDFELAAIVSRRAATVNDLPVVGDVADLAGIEPGIEAVAFCSPPRGRQAQVRSALEAGLDVLLEKPPTAMVTELDELEVVARRQGRVLFTTWHSQYNAAVAAAGQILAAEGVAELRMTWRENVRRWHPGQDWVWEPGGFGVFDPGTNGFSILTRILPFPLAVSDCTMSVPENRQTPIAAEVTFASPSEAPMTATLDWRAEKRDVWEIAVRTGIGKALTLRGGSRLFVDDVRTVEEPKREYPAIYRRFSELLETRQSWIDPGPLKLAADCFLLARREAVAPFDW